MKNIDCIKDIIEKTFELEIQSIQEMNKRAIFLGTDFFFDIEENEDILYLSGISIPKDKRGKGLSKKIIQNMEIFAKDNNYKQIEIPAVVSNKAAKACKSLGYKNKEFNYPNFDTSLYEEFDGFYGSYFKQL